MREEPKIPLKDAVEAIAPLYTFKLEYGGVGTLARDAGVDETTLRRKAQSLAKEMLKEKAGGSDNPSGEIVTGAEEINTATTATDSTSATTSKDTDEKNGRTR